MIQRCTNSNNSMYKYYGNRGIGVCEEWLEFPNFLKDMGKHPGLGYSLDRKNNKKGYYKENCRWATRKQQNRNKRNNLYVQYNNKKRLIIELAEEFDISYYTLRSRIVRGWSIEKALTTSVGKYTKN